MSYYDFGETLKRLRESHGLTQSELGSHIGISKAVISKYETGMGYPSLDVLTRFQSTSAYQQISYSASKGAKLLMSPV